MRIALALALCLLATAAAAAPRAFDEYDKSSQTDKDLREAYLTRLNQNAVTIMGGSPASTDLKIVNDLAAVLDDGDNLRVLPMVGKGAAQTVQDVLFLRGVDMGITHANILKHFEKTGELGSNLNGQIAYVAKLFNEELHVLVRSDVTKFDQLKGKTVSFGQEGSGSQLTGRWVFEALGVPVKEIALPAEDAIKRVKSGEIAAAVLLSGKPSGLLDQLNREQDLRFLSMPYPTQLEDYYPAVLTHDDYPNLIGADEKIDTVSVCAVLAVFNWKPKNPRNQKIDKFVDAFFTNFDKLLAPPHHPKWRDVNFAATLEGWQRARAAQAWLDKASGAAPTAQRQAFQKFLAENAPDTKTAEEQERLFKAFTEWSKTKKPRRSRDRAANKDND